jgi:hypothetical protein
VSSNLCAELVRESILPSGDILVWLDWLVTGPTPQTASLEEMSRIRGHYLGDPFPWPFANEAKSPLMSPDTIGIPARRAVGSNARVRRSHTTVVASTAKHFVCRYAYPRLTRDNQTTVRNERQRVRTA